VVVSGMAALYPRLGAYWNFNLGVAVDVGPDSNG
jgi:hypothetical protein